MQEDQIGVAETEATTTTEASVEDLGLEVVEDVPQIAMARPIRHIRAPQ